MTLYSKEETRFDLSSSEQLIKKYLEGISDELLNLFWDKSSIELKQIVEEIILIDKDIEFYNGVKFGLLLSVITILESINKSIHSPSIIRGMLLVRKLVEVVKKNID